MYVVMQFIDGMKLLILLEINISHKIYNPREPGDGNAALWPQSKFSNLVCKVLHLQVRGIILTSPLEKGDN